jgi:hypothetical protein
MRHGARPNRNEWGNARREPEHLGENVQLLGRRLAPVEHNNN